MHNEWYKKKWVEVSLHLLFWSLLFILPYLLRTDANNEPKRNKPDHQLFFLYLHLVNNILRVLLFYGNAFILIPRLLYQKKYGQYILSLIFALALMLLLDRLFFSLPVTGLHYKIKLFFLFNLPSFLFIVISSTAFRTIRDKILEDQRIKEKETENLKTELSFLRSQVSPHFMFNVLNNMVALARKKSDDLEPSLITLSSLLRYMLYETDEQKVPIEKEVAYLQNYIDLQKQRFGKNIQVKSDFNDVEKGHNIEPMLLIPFVENAFKHGTGLIENAAIDIKLHLQNQRLQFTVRNRYNEQVVEMQDKTSGIGLNNVKRRLNLLYGKDHLLEIVKKDGWFTVLLKLKLH